MAAAVLKKLAKASAFSAVAGTTAFYLYTRKCSVSYDLENDYMFTSLPAFERLNPNKCKPVHDECIRRVRIRDIKPEFVEKPGELVKAYCAGVFGGRGESFCVRSVDALRV